MVKRLPEIKSYRKEYKIPKFNFMKKGQATEHVNQSFFIHALL